MTKVEVINISEPIKPLVRWVDIPVGSFYIRDNLDILGESNVRVRNPDSLRIKTSEETVFHVNEGKTYHYHNGWDDIRALTYRIVNTVKITYKV